MGLKIDEDVFAPQAIVATLSSRWRGGDDLDVELVLNLVAQRRAAIRGITEDEVDGRT